MCVLDEEVLEVAVDPIELLDFPIQLDVDGLKLFVDRLDLFLRCLQLLVGRLQLLVERKQLLVGRCQLGIGLLQLVDAGFQRSAGGLEFLCELLNERLLGLKMIRPPPGPAACSGPSRSPER